MSLKPHKNDERTNLNCHKMLLNQGHHDNNLFTIFHLIRVKANKHEHKIKIPLAHILLKRVYSLLRAFIIKVVFP